MRLLRNFLLRYTPIWAKAELMAENQRLERQIAALRAKLAKKEAYIAGLEAGIRRLRPIFLRNREEPS